MLHTGEYLLILSHTNNFNFLDMELQGSASTKTFPTLADAIAAKERVENDTFFHVRIVQILN